MTKGVHGYTPLISNHPGHRFFTKVVPMITKRRQRISRRRLKYIPQVERNECGPVSLAMVLEYYGCHTYLPELRQACGVSHNGTDARSIVEVARTYGLASKGAQCPLDCIAELPLPAIMHWDFCHFLVLERVMKNRIVVVDPAWGRRCVSMDKVRYHFTGVVLLFAPTDRLLK